MRETKNIIFFILICLLLTSINVQSQSLKNQLRQQQQQQQYERELQENELKEQARIKKALLHLNDLVKLLQSKDLDYVDKYLSDKGWKFNNTYMDILNKGESLAIKRVEWCFDKDLFDNNLASGWFSLYIYPTYDNAISYFWRRLLWGRL